MTLSQFLVALGENPALRAQFAANPGAVMETAGLSQSEARALTGGDQQTIYNAAGAEGAAPPKIISLPAVFA